MDPLHARSRRAFLGAVGTLSGGTLVGAPWAQGLAPAQYGLDPKLVYLNTASLGPTPRAVLDRTISAWLELEMNPVRMAYGDGDVHLATDRVRERAAALLGCTSDELLIARSTTDAMNTLALAVRLERGDRVLTTTMEHEGGSNGWRYRARRDGVVLDAVPLSPSDSDPEAVVRRFADKLTPSTRVISVSHVIAATGLRMPVAEIAALARTRGVLCVVDGAQAVGGLDVNVRALGCHAYAASGHKWLLGPKGTGLLFIDRDAGDAIDPVERQDGRRFVAGSTGMGSLPLVVGLGAAIDAAATHGLAAVERQVLALRNRAYAGLRGIPRVTPASPPPGPQATGLLTVQLPSEVSSRALRDRLLTRHGVVVKMIEPALFNGIRLSPHTFNTDADIDAALAALGAELA
jgi:selenocysteine lyase/cysteine desulfurase